MKKRQIFLLVITLCMLFTFVSCNKQKVSKLSNNISKSLESVKQVTSQTTMKEKDTIVYEYVKTIKFNEEKAVVTTSTSTLNSKFELQTTTNEEQTTDFSKKDLFKLTIDKKLFSNIKESKNEVSFDVSSNNISKVFNNQEIKSSSNAHFQFIFEDGKIVSMECKFTTESLKDVVITCKYEY